MAKFVESNGEFHLILDSSEFKKLGLNEVKDYEIVKGKEDIFLLLGREASVNDKVLLKLKETPLKERVEGVFEKTLSKEELTKFNYLLSVGKIVKFKLNPQYSKAVYKSKDELNLKQEENRKPSAAVKKNLVKTEENPHDYSLEENGFLILRNEFKARKMSQDLSQQIKNGEIKGIKGFDGMYYIIQMNLLEELSPKLVSVLSKKKETDLEALSKELNLNKDLVKIVCEFLKEDGEVIEKRKGFYRYVE